MNSGKLSIRRYARIARDWYYRIRYPLFARVQRETRGLLTARVYKEIYDVVSGASDQDVVDIGAAGGGTSICCALAMKDTGKKSAVVAVEKCQGGSRASYGGYEDNLDYLNGAIKHFGVDDKIRLFADYLTFENADEFFRLVHTPSIGGFIHDADGRLDRDFMLLWEKVVPGGFIIVDDYRLQDNFRPISSRYPAGGTKKLMTYRFLNKFIEWGFIDVDRQIGDVVFGRKPAIGEFSRFDRGECDRILASVQDEYDARV